MFTVQGDPLRVFNLAARDEPVAWDEAVPAVVARCESDGCGLVYELDDLRLTGEQGWLGDCADCGGPLYVVNRHEVPWGDEPPEALVDLLAALECRDCEGFDAACPDHQMFWRGWDASGALMAAHAAGARPVEWDPYRWTPDQGSDDHESTPSRRAAS